MRAAGVPEWIWAPAGAGALCAILGATGQWAAVPWLFPSLGPTIFLQVHAPRLPSARPYNVIAGHAMGAVAAALGVLVTGAGQAPPVLSTGELSWSRVWASVIAMTLTLLFQSVGKAGHPPAAATALLISLGGVSLTPHDMGVLAAGVLLTAVLGELLRRARMGGTHL